MNTPLPDGCSDHRFSLFEKHFSELAHPLCATVQRLLNVSDYATRHVQDLKGLMQEDDCQTPLFRKDYFHFVGELSLEVSSHQFARLLRYFRHRHLLRIMLREQAHLADTQETMTAWSHCADALIWHTIAYCDRQLKRRYGQPMSEEGLPVELYCIAMGKLGGCELNYSSDVDLIFAFSASGYTHAASSISNVQYFGKLVQQVAQLLQQMTPEGFVFRVDLRLRPNGESGPLVSSLAALETYYQEQGRDWERYAMVKARPITFCDEETPWFKRLILPFVYRRYVDFSALESLRSMKLMIEREVQLNPMLDDIKRGKGGIREVEFIIQSVQLIRGGRLPQIQHQNAILALHALKKEGLLAHTAALQQAYLFLRQLENVLQMQNDQQTHALPQDSLKQAKVVAAMDERSWDDLLDKLHQYQRIISHAFHAVLNQANVYQDEKRLLANQLLSLWQGHIEPTMAINLLSALGFNSPERCYQMIHDFRHSSRCRRLTQAARMRLDRFMVLLLSELMTMVDTDAVLLPLLRLLDHIVGRSAYLALLTENLPALQELLFWFSHSPFISHLLVQHPFLLEVLIDEQQTWRPPSKLDLSTSLQARLMHAREEEEQDEMLRQFKLTYWLLAARAELYAQVDALRIGKFLADLAEVIIASVLTLACQRLSHRYPEIEGIKTRFAIIAYGKLGSREMNYDSDVDLVFLHGANPSSEGLVTRLTQKVLHMLTTRSQTGLLYPVDTRLRPSGAAGLLVSHMDAFMDYQRLHAWTWEHQALLRARVLYAHPKDRAAFKNLKKTILFKPRKPEQLLEDIDHMREKIDRHVDNNAIKHDEGGLLDLEFLVQYLVLLHPKKEYLRCTNTLSLLQQLQKAQIITAYQFKQLQTAYARYHSALHRQRLNPGSIEWRGEPQQVAAIWQQLTSLK